MSKKLLLLILLLSSFSFAIVNVEPPVIGENEGVTGEVALGASYSTGNSDTTSVGVSAKGEYGQKEWLVYLIASYNYGESNEVTDTNNNLIHLRYVHNIQNTSYDYEFFLQTEFNEFQDIKARNLVGANIRKRLDLPFDKIYAALGLFHSHMEPDTVNEFNPIYDRVRMNSYLSFLKNINENFSITYLGFYQPNVENFSDYRISQILQLNTSITEDVVLGLDVNHAYNATPYNQIEKSDVKSTINLRYKFK